MALGLPGAVEGEHMGHPDFRFNGRIFASIPKADEEWGMVKLTPEQQAEFVADRSGAFTPAAGAWGREGCTLIDLRRARVGRVTQALVLAFEALTAADRKRLTKRTKGGERTYTVRKEQEKPAGIDRFARREPAAGRGASEESAVAHVALLRGVNVGGKNLLPMKDLCALFTKAGCLRVRSYIQSGNVVFCAPAGEVEDIAAAMEIVIERKFGFRPVIVVRSAKGLANVLASNPFLKDGSARVNEGALHVGFLAKAPPARQVEALETDRSPGDSFKVIGSEVYLHLPGGVARTKLTNAWFDSVLKTTCTVRTWRTVKRLAEMAAEAEA